MRGITLILESYLAITPKNTMAISQTSFLILCANDASLLLLFILNNEGFL